MIRSSIIQAKFGPSEIKARSLLRYAFHSGNMDAFLSHYAALKAEAIYFVPIHWRRRLTRGFDLSALLANSLGGHLKIPVFYAIYCAKAVAPSTLSSSKEERLERIKDRFKLKASYPRHQKVILVDDIITTGTTLKSVSQLLFDAGCDVHTLTLARNL